MKNSFIYKFIVSGLAIIALVVSVLTHVLPSYAASTYYSVSASGPSRGTAGGYTFSSVSVVCTVTCDDDYNIYFYKVSGSGYVGIRATSFSSSGGAGSVTVDRSFVAYNNSGDVVYSTTEELSGQSCVICDFSDSSYICSVYLWDSYSAAQADAAAGGDGTFTPSDYEDSSDVPIPEGDLYLNSSQLGDGSNKYYQGIQLTNYDPEYTVVYKTRYTIPTYVTVNATSSSSGKVNVLSYYTSGISLDTCTFNSSSEAYFVFYNKLLTEYQRVYWTDGGLYDLTDDVSLAFYRQDGSLTTSTNAYYEFYGDYDSIVADSSPCVRNVSSPFVGKEIWIAYQITDSIGNTYTSEYQKFIVYPLSSATYNRLLTRYFWDASNIDSGVVYDSTSSSNVGNDTIYESSALISNATGDTNLSGSESGSSNNLNVNVDDVSDAMTSITSLMGNVPVWFAYIFGMFPDWLITLLSIGIAWVIVVGMIKLLKW